MSPLLKSLVYVFYAILVFQISRLALCVLYIEKFIPLAFINGIRFDLNVIATFWSVPIILINLPIRRWNRVIFDLSAAFMYLTFVIMALMLAVDIGYFGYVQKHISTEIISIREDTKFIVDIILNHYATHLVVFITFCIVSLYFWMKVARAKTKFPSKTKQIAISLIIVVVIAILMRGTISSKPIHIIDAFSHGREFGNISLNGAFTIYRTLYSMRKSLDTNEMKSEFFRLEEAISILGLKEDYPFEKQSTHCLEEENKNKNIVVLILESWTPEYIDSISAKEYGVTKNFDKILKNGTYIPNFYAAGIRSIQGIQAIITGLPVIPSLPPVSFGLESVKFLGIGEILKKNEYKTIFIQSSKRRSYRLDSLAKASGFEYVYGMEDIKRDLGILLNYKSPTPPFGWDYETLMFTLKKIREIGEKFAVFVFTGSTHPTYPKLPEFSKYEYSPKGLGGYLNALNYSDWSLGEFMKEAEKEKWFKNTIFIFIADHPGHQKEGFKEKVHIPFVIYPRVISDVIDVVGSQYDLVPTILDILCIKSNYYSIGKSVFRKNDQDFIFTTLGELIGAISKDGYIAHNTLKIISAEGKTDELEKKLLALLQVSLWAIRKNRWAR